MERGGRGVMLSRRVQREVRRWSASVREVVVWLAVVIMGVRWARLAVRMRRKLGSDWRSRGGGWMRYRDSQRRGGRVSSVSGVIGMAERHRVYDRAMMVGVMVMVNRRMGMTTATDTPSTGPTGAPNRVKGVKGAMCLPCYRRPSRNHRLQVKPSRSPRLRTRRKCPSSRPR